MAVKRLKERLENWVLYAPLIFVLISGVFANILVYQYFSLTDSSYDQMQIALLSSFLFGLFMVFATYWFALRLKKRLAEYDAEVSMMEVSLKRKNKDLESQLYEDAITQIPNRKSFEKTLAVMDEPKLFIIDIDAFKDVNDYYSNEIGDYILQVIAKRLKSFAKEYSYGVYRVGADEFALLHDEVLDIEKSEKMISALVAHVKGMNIAVPQIESELQIDCTIGACLENENVFSKSMIALSVAKKNQKDYVSYMKSMDTKDAYVQQIQNSNIIKEALEFDRVVPFFQPIFNRKNEVVKYECLARIKLDNGEFVSPGKFIGTSKKVRLYSLMVKRLIEKSFKRIAGTETSLSLNLLARDMMDSDVSNFVLDKIQEYSLAKQIVLEILEDENIEQLDRVKLFLNKIKRMGVRIAIDDFGTGYSNFSYLNQIQPDYIKIDGSLIKNIDEDDNSLAIVQAIISFCQTLGIKTIAEFVHSQAVYETCLDLGIDEFQGFLLAPPKEHLIKE